MTTIGTMSDNEWQRMTTGDNKWQWMIANDSEWYNEWKRMRAGKTMILSLKMKQKTNLVPE